MKWAKSEINRIILEITWLILEKFYRQKRRIFKDNNHIWEQRPNSLKRKEKEKALIDKTNQSF